MAHISQKLIVTGVHVATTWTQNHVVKPPAQGQNHGPELAGQEEVDAVDYQNRHYHFRAATGSFRVGETVELTVSSIGEDLAES